MNFGIIISGAIFAVTIIFRYLLPKLLEILLDKGIDTITRFFPKLCSSSRAKKSKQYHEALSSESYKKFVFRILKKYYADGGDNGAFFPTINDRIYSIIYFKGIPVQAKKSIRDFNFLCDKSGSILTFDLKQHKNYQHYGYYREYSELLVGLVKYPDRPGYMLDELKLNKKGEVAGIKVHVGTFAENVYSTHVLEYELYSVYKKFKDRDIENQTVWNELCFMLHRRNQIHNLAICKTKNGSAIRVHTSDLRQLYNSIRKFNNTHSLLSVQMLVIIKSSRTHKHELKIVRRSSKTVHYHGIYQFIPAGGFEVLNDSEDGIYSESELRNECSAGYAVFREYLEELLNRPEFEGNSTGNVEERLLKDPGILEIEEMIADKRAIFMFLGSVVGLECLRHELSFLLLIEDEEYDAKNRFITNWESVKGRIEENVTIENFESNEEIWRNLHGPSAGMWQLFKETDYYQRVLEADKRI